MSENVKSGVMCGIAAGVRRFQKNIQGVAAVEFGYLVPLLIAMVIGAFEISRMISMDRKFGLVTSLVADMIAQERTMSQAQLNAIYDIAGHIMAPYDVDESDLKISVTPVMRCPGADMDYVYATDANRQGYRGGAAEEPYNTPYGDLAEGILQRGASVIVVETSMQYRPMLFALSEYWSPGMDAGGIPWEDKAVLAPRNNCVDFDGNNGQCPPPPSCP